MYDDREAFGPSLRRERERRNVSLDDISSRTKIGRSLLEKLERGDLSGWPSGIYRRAFFRDYAAAIGLDGEELLGHFLRLFPDPGADPALPPAGPTPAPPLRLMLDASARSSRATGLDLRQAAVDTAAIAGAAGALWVAFGHPAVMVAIVATLFHAVAAATRGSSRSPISLQSGTSSEEPQRRESTGRRAARPRARFPRRAGDGVAVRGTQTVS